MRDRRVRGRLLDGLDLQADLDLVPDQDAAGLERGVPVQAEVLAVERRPGAEPGHGEAVRALVRAQVLALERDRAGDAADGQIIAINLTGVFNGIKAAVPALIRAGGGAIINISSTAGLRGYPALPGYTAAKYGVRGLTKAVALDVGKHGIRVNSVHPGVIRTPMTAEIPEDAGHVALDRVGEPEEVANLIVFLASDESPFCTGAEFIIDGGETAGMVTRMVTNPLKP